MVYISKNLRQFVLQRAENHCEYCKLPQRPSGIALEVDHIKPLANEGKTDKQNLCASCRNCNSRKSDFDTGIDPETQQGQPLFNPRTHIWSEHFAWSGDGTRIIGLTPIGRATVARLKMNLDLVVESRGDWLTLGWKPPAN
ncbi:MAG: HNH endonuclease signature motif containing protein [Anaerolineae bacterium]|nr:HNH endonuclease signature motif containing protein [Anaerolineae bacterium]